MNTNFTKIIKKVHENKWVALSPDQKKVIAVSEKLVDLSRKLKGREVVYMKVPSSKSLLAF